MYTRCYQSPCRGSRRQKQDIKDFYPIPQSPEWRVPRLCHTYSFPPAAPTTKLNGPEFVQSSYHRSKQVTHQKSPLRRRRRHYAPEEVKSFPRTNHQRSATTVVLSKQRKSRPKTQQQKFSCQGVSFRVLHETVLSAPPASSYLRNNLHRTTTNPQNIRHSAPHHTHVIVRKRLTVLPDFIFLPRIRM
ncbi:hypothetical protein evm_014289 [Chilo suppressalis]|nr:hypothetical protein evm_014289 [Chilo suppressalis]